MGIATGRISTTWALSLFFAKSLYKYLPICYNNSQFLIWCFQLFAWGQSLIKTKDNVVLYSWFFSRYVNSACFPDVDHSWNLTPRKNEQPIALLSFWQTHSWKYNREKTENQPFAEFKYLEKNQLYGTYKILLHTKC